MKNLGTMDRLLRVILAEICILVAFFWVAEEWQIPLYLIAGVMLLQAGTATCSIYTLLGWNRCEIVRRKDKNLMTAFVVVALVLAVAGSYASAVLTKNIFLEDLGGVNESYAQRCILPDQAGERMQLCSTESWRAPLQLFPRSTANTGR